MWSGRFRQPLDPEFEKWQRSFPYDRRLLPFELAASRAHANALEHAGVLSSEELSKIVNALEEIGHRAASSPEFLTDPEAEDVHHFVEKQLAALIGATGYKLHTGRSRNEQIATDLRLFVRQSIDTLRTLIADWIEAILARAEAAASASSLFAMPAYTHLQPAEPVLVAHWLLAYIEMFLRDASRLADCRRRANLCPLGSGAVAGATLTLNRQAMAAELGFDVPTANSIDATSDRDFAIDFVDALSLLAERGVPSRLAHEAVGKAVQLAVERGCDLQKLPLTDLQAIHSCFDAAFHSCLGLTQVLGLHDVPGGTAPRHVKRALQNARDRAASLR